MSSIVTVRIPPQKLAKVDRRAAELGQDRSGYVRALIEQDLKSTGGPRKHVFASEDLAGCIRTGLPRGDNRTVRRAVQERLMKRNAAHR